jgi:hypothetical protein
MLTGKKKGGYLVTLLKSTSKAKNLDWSKLGSDLGHIYYIRELIIYTYQANFLSLP